MAQQTLKTVVTIGGRVDNTFGKLGESLLVLGSQIEGVSRKVINFGKESVTNFTKYEDVMLMVKQLGGYSEKTMSALDNYNKSIAQTSKYSMDQAANAELLMARLGLNLEQTKTLMPTVMNLATAANIDLATSLDYLYYSVSALGKPMSYANTLSDQMAKAADVSAAGIDTLGQSLQRIGSGASFFAGGSSEILAILAGISQFGADMQGTSAGTQLRNFMLTLLAPTKGKQTIMDAFKISETEWAEFESYMADAEIDVTNTAEAMNQLGLNVYDTQGQLKPAIQIIGELNAALATMSESEKNKMLGDLFGKRTTTTAMNLVTALGDIIKFQQLIEGGSAGYTEQLAGAQESGLGGTIRELTAAYEGLKTVVGDNMSPEVGAVAGFLHDIVVDISSMDEPKLSALVGGMEAVAVAGPGMLIAGGALRLIGTLATPVGATAAAVAALAIGGVAAAKYFTKLNEISFESKFGDLELDKETLLGHVNGITEAFTSSYTEINAFGAALDSAVESYTAASSSLSSELLTNMITGATLTEDQIASMQSLGTTMGNSLLDGIHASFDQSASYLAMLYGGYDQAAGDAEYGNAIILAKQLQDQLLLEAKTIGDDFGSALGSAMDDGIITGDEYTVIMEKMQAYNEAMAFASHADQAGALARQLHKAGGVSWDSAESFLGEQQGIMNAAIEDAELTHAEQMAKWRVYYEKAIAEGYINKTTGKAYTWDDYNALVAEATASKNAQVEGYKGQNAKVVAAVFEALVAGSDFAGVWPFLQEVFGKDGNYQIDPATGLPEVDWAGMDAAGLWTEDTSDMLLAYSNAAEKLKKYFGDYQNIPEISRYLDQMDYLFGLSSAANAYYNRKYIFGESGGTVDPMGEFGSGSGDPEENVIEFPAVITGLEENAKEAQTAAQAIMNANPVMIPVYMKRLQRIAPGTVPMLEVDAFAEGGRATEASIFGEAGPEWAIPEEHTARTAQLLWKAAEASGFSWADIAAAGSGSSSGGGNTLVYSPTIVANDSTGVEQKLRDDKANLEKWLREKELKDKISLYA